MENNKPEGKEIPVVRTFESDAAGYIKDEGVTRAKIALAEAERPNQDKNKFKFEEKTFDWDKAKNILYVSGILILGGVVIFLSFVFLGPKDRPTPPKVGETPIIIIDSEKIVNITNLEKGKAYELLQRQIRESTVGINNILLFRIIKNEGETVTETGSAGFLELISAFHPQSFERTLENSFALGIIGTNGSQPFLILKTDSYETAYGGIREWERTMPKDLEPVFAKENGWVNTTPAYGVGAISASIFSDHVASNIDTRVLKNSEGKIVFIYAFVDNKTIVMTTNEETFTNIVSKLRNSRLLK